MSSNQPDPVFRRACLIALILFRALPLHAQAVDARVDSLLHAMTLDEKISFLHGARDPAGHGQAGYIPGVPRLGVPPLRMTDGPAGVRLGLPATALPAPVTLAASFDPALARLYGETMGREGRALDQDVLLAPMVNIVRVPTGGRNFETLGEDPLLASRLVAEEVRGIQGAGMIATIKHYVANNFENARNRVSADVGEQALREIYLPGFEAAVRAGAGSVMCAYNRVNELPACDHPELLEDVLRGSFGFQGWVMTDWGAAHSSGALEAGLDQEMPRDVFFGDSLVAALRAGRTQEADVDQAVRRILLPMARAGLLDPVPPARPVLDSAADSRVAREVALAGAVLLKNAGGVLPLAAGSLNNVVFVGPTVAQTLVGGGGSAHVLPLRRGSALAAFESRLSGGRVRYYPGIDLDGVVIPASALGTLARTRDGTAAGQDRGIDFTGARALEAGHDWAWTGTLVAPETGDYEIKVRSSGARASVTMDGTPSMSRFGGSLIPSPDGLSNVTTVVHLEAGTSHPIEVRASGGRGSTPVELRLAWVTPSHLEQMVEEAVAAAAGAPAVVVFAHAEASEGRDRESMSLPLNQDALIAALARANPRTVVVLQTGDPVLMPWIDDVAAVLETWFPGQDGGETTAALLLGEANPSGKLPVTFPRAAADAPTADTLRYPGTGGRAAYSEGILVGYRWYDAKRIEPLFPFGHGLSYTTFAYDSLSVRPERDGVDVSFIVRNTGRRAGAEVAQVYLGAVAGAPVPMAPQALAGFQRVSLNPGESRRLTVHIEGRTLSSWFESGHAWHRVPGTRVVAVGTSSRDIRLRGEVEVQAGRGG